MPYFGGYRAPYLYGAYLGWPPVINPWLFGSSDSYDSDNSGQYANGNANSLPYVDNGNGLGQYANDRPEDYGAAPYSQAPQLSRPSYAPWSQPLPSTAPSAPEVPVTLIFKDGRPPEHIRNYLLTSTKLTVLDDHYREIPLEQINMATTEEANRSAGIDFRVPRKSR